MRDAFAYAWRTRRAWFYTALCRSQSRFTRTALGSFWLGISNLLTVSVLGVVYGTVFSTPSIWEYIVYLGLGITFWSYISSSVQSAASVIDHNSRNILNSNTNPVYYIMEEWAFQLQSFGQSFLVIVVALSFIQHNLILNIIKSGLLPIINIIGLCLWLPTFICILGARYRDLYQLTPIVLQLLFLISPILYQKKSLGKFSFLAEMNPLYAYLQAARTSIINGSLNLEIGLMLLVLNLLGLMLSLYYLEKSKKDFPYLF